MSVPQKTRSRTIGWRDLVQRYDPHYKAYQPVVYYFSGGKTKKDWRVPGNAR